MLARLNVNDSSIIVFLLLCRGNSCTSPFWRYSPNLFAKDGAVDPLSLYLSLDEKHDDRVGIAMEHLLENVWSRDLLFKEH